MAQEAQLQEEWLEEVIAFWRALMHDGEAKTAERLKASENLVRYLQEQPREEGAENIRFYVDYTGA